MNKLLPFLHFFPSSATPDGARSAFAQRGPVHRNDALRGFAAKS